MHELFLIIGQFASFAVGIECGIAAGDSRSMYGGSRPEIFGIRHAALPRQPHQGLPLFIVATNDNQHCPRELFPDAGKKSINSSCVLVEVADDPEKRPRAGYGGNVLPVPSTGIREQVEVGSIKDYVHFAGQERESFFPCPYRYSAKQ